MLEKVNIFIIVFIIFIFISVCVFGQNKVNYEILVDVEESKLYLMKDNVLYKQYNCAGGKESTPSPIGTWKVIKKAKWGEGFGGSWIGINVPWGNFGIHGTTIKYSIGWNSSHGCIRMNNKEVAQLYNIIPLGTKVTIVNGVYGAFGKGFRNLKSGMYGSDVLEIQKKLKQLGFFEGMLNGKFEAKTEEAVKKYCKANNIYIRKTINIELQKHMGFYLMD